VTAATAGTMAQVLAGLLIAVLLEGRWLAQAARQGPAGGPDALPLSPGSRLRVPLVLLSLLSVLIGIAGTTLALSLALSVVAEDEPAGPQVAGFIVAGSVAAILSVMLPPFLFVLMVFVADANRIAPNQAFRRLLEVVGLSIMVIAFAGLVYLVILGFRLEMDAG
jgi:hypothetical protein